MFSFCKLGHNLTGKDSQLCSASPGIMPDATGTYYVIGLGQLACLSSPGCFLSHFQLSLSSLSIFLYVKWITGGYTVCSGNLCVHDVHTMFY